MADKKISALTGASTPVAGSEVLPIVQSGATVKVSIDNLTTGKTVPTNGVQFPATQVASADANCLDDYEEGTWTPVVTPYSGSITTMGAVAGTYTKVGRQVTVFCTCTITINGTAGTLLFVKGMPFAPNLSTVSYYSGSGYSRNVVAFVVEFAVDGALAPQAAVYTYNGGYPGGNALTFNLAITYNV